MYLANPWGLLGLFALPVIFYIHFYRRRFPPRRIAGLFLWLSPRQQSPAGKMRQRPPVTLSLILELLAALLVTLLLSDLRIQTTGKYRHLVFVLDSSASMAARDQAGQSSTQRAKAFVQEQLTRPDTYLQATLILTGKRPAILGRSACEPEEAIASLDSYKPGLSSHSPAEALSLALDIAGAQAEIFFVSDQLPPEDEQHRQVTYMAVGQPRDNVGFVAAQWRPDYLLAKDEIFMRIANFSDRTKQVQLTGRLGEQTILQRTIDIAGGAQEKMVWKAPSGVEQIQFDLAPDDSLDLDNHIVMIKPARKVVTVANLFPDGTVREQIDRALAVIKDIRVVNSAQSAQLVIGPPQQFESAGDGSWWLLIGPLSGEYRAEGQPKNMVGPFLMETTHPLLEGVSLQGVIWAGAAPAKSNLTPIVSGGNIPLITRVGLPMGRAYWFNMNLERSNLTLSPDWPILVSNLVELRRTELPGLSRRSFRLGEVIRYPRSDPAAKLRLTGPQGYDKELPPSAQVYLAELGTAGIYRILSDRKASESFSLNLLDDKESDLRGLGRGRCEGELLAGSFQLAKGGRPSWVNFLVGALILLAVLWNWHLNRRSEESV